MAFDSAEITEWMGYCLTQNDTWLAEYKKECDLKAFAELSVDEQAEKFKEAFKVKK